MTAQRLLALAMRSVLRNKVRSLLTILGVVIGVGSVVMMIAVGRGAQAAVQASIQSLGSNLIVITPGSSSRGGVSGGAGSLNRLSVEDAQRIDREAQLVAAVTPVIMAPTMLVGGVGNWRTMVYGVDVSYQEIRTWELESGRFFNEEELRTRRKVVVLGQSVAKALFPEEEPLGQIVRTRGVPMTVIGLLMPKGQTAEGSDQDDVVLAPYTTVQTRLAGRQFIGQILASATSEEEMAGALDEVKVLMREGHRGAEDDYEVRDQRQLAEAAQGTAQVMTYLLSAIASISLLVGGIGIMNIMLVSVTERTREIGIRRAVGARRRDVLAQFLVESVVLSSFGGLLGAALGVGGAQILGKLTGWATVVESWTLLVSMGFSVAVGVFFGWFPARRAASLDPITALRHE